MRIGIDVHWAAYQGGTGTFTRSLTSALLAQFPGVDWRLYCTSLSLPLLAVDFTPYAPLLPVDGSFQVTRTFATLARRIHQDGLDLFYSPGYFVPVTRTPSVATFHDANALAQWGYRFRPGRRVHTASLALQSLLSSRLADRIVTDSGAAAADLRHWYRIPPSRLTAVYPGVNQPAAPLPLPGSISTWLRHRPYILSVGEITHHKNQGALVPALSLLDPSTALILVGPENPGYTSAVLEPAVAAGHLEDRVLRVGPVDRPTLESLYWHANAFAFPSLGEGFGLPPLEAMAHGVPVVASRAGSLPEVLGTAALFPSSLHPIPLSAALRTALVPGPERARLVAEGQGRVALFTWETAASRYMDLFQSVVAGPRYNTA